MPKQEQRQPEAVLQEEERARLAANVQSSDDAIIAKTLDGIITSWNPGAQKIYGYSAGEAVGQPISMLARPNDPTRYPGSSRGFEVEQWWTIMRPCA
jgi:PAS domain S-box-containing protein